MSSDRVQESISSLQKLYRRLVRGLTKLQSLALRMHYRALGSISVAPDATLSPRATLQMTHGKAAAPQIEIGSKAKIKEYAILGPRNGFIKVGNGSTINPFCVLLGYGGIEVGDNVRIAAGTSIIAFNHNFSDPDKPIAEQGNNQRGIVIEDDVWIGAGVKILDGVRIGTGCVIGANSTVTRSIPPFSLAVGSPATVIKSRKAE